MLPVLIAAACWAAAGYVVGSDALERQKSFHDEVGHAKKFELSQEEIEDLNKKVNDNLETLIDLAARQKECQYEDTAELKARIHRLETALGLNEATKEELEKLKIELENKNA
jgi:histidinol dehydrogenase